MLQDVKPLSGDVADALTVAFERYYAYLNSFGADEGYLRKKVENELGMKLIHLKMRCSGLGGDWGRVLHLSLFLTFSLTKHYCSIWYDGIREGMEWFIPIPLEMDKWLLKLCYSVIAGDSSGNIWTFWFIYRAQSIKNLVHSSPFYPCYCCFHKCCFRWILLSAHQLNNNGGSIVLELVFPFFFC